MRPIDCRPSGMTSGVTVRASRWPPRSICHTCASACPPDKEPRMLSRSCWPSTMGVLPTRKTRSPLRRPARAPAPSGLTSPSSGRVQGPSTPMVRNSWASASWTSSGARAITTSRRAPWAVVASSRRTSRLSSAPRVSSQRNSSNEATSSNSSPSQPARVTVSPPWMPAFSATEPMVGLARIALGSSTPLQLTRAYKNTASSRFAAGPAATMAARLGKDWVLNAIWRSSAATGASRSSSIFTKPPSGNALMTNSVGEPLGCQRSTVWPKPMENFSTLTPQATATR